MNGHLAVLEKARKVVSSERHRRYATGWMDTDELDALLSEMDAAIALMRGQSEVSCEAWAIVRPDGVTIHPESVRGSEHAAQWGIGEWPRMRESGFTCVPVRISVIPSPPAAKQERDDA